jgi:hypothetical protein
VLEVTFADGTSWKYELPDDALVSVPNAPSPRGVPRSELSRVAPAKGDPKATCVDDKGKKFWHGQVSPITGESATFARCVFGTWVEHQLGR